MKKRIGIDLKNNHKAISLAVEENSIQEVAKNPELEEIKFAHDSILFVSQIFEKEIDCLKEKAQLFDRLFRASALRRIALVYLNEKLEENEVIIWSRYGSTT
jgi:hypothetical protein